MLSQSPNIRRTNAEQSDTKPHILAVVLYICIPKILDSNLGLDTGYPKFVLMLSSVPPSKRRKCVAIKPQPLPL
jgi:hypothetical protein